MIEGPRLRDVCVPAVCAIVATTRRHTHTHTHKNRHEDARIRSRTRDQVRSTHARTHAPGAFFPCIDIYICIARTYPRSPISRRSTLLQPKLRRSGAEQPAASTADRCGERSEGRTKNTRQGQAGRQRH